jgi:hypothetical protein
MRFLKLAVWMSLAFFALLALALGLARAAVDPLAADLRALWQPDGCAVPCWQGIRLGVTASDEALNILHRLDWVGDINAVQGIVTSDSVVSWSWTGRQPAIIDTERSGRMWLHRGLVYSIELPMRVDLASVWNAAGAPEQVKAIIAPRVPPAVFYHALYFGGLVDVSGVLPCPWSAYRLLTMRVNMRLAGEPDPTFRSRSSERSACA